MGPLDPTTTHPAWALHGTAASQAIERRALQAHPPGTLMNRAGAAVARLALALLAQRSMGAAQGLALPSGVMVVAGPGANGGDGWVAAHHLHHGDVPVTAWEPMGCRSADAARARQAALAAGVTAQAHEPAADLPPPALVIDALFGLGLRGRMPQASEIEAQASNPDEPSDRAAAALRWLHHQGRLGSTILAVDLPSGLDAQTGSGPLHDPSGAGIVQADHTLSLLTLKPGLYTHQGRAAAGRIWLDDLGCGGLMQVTAPTAWLSAGATLQTLLLKPRLDARRGWRHAGHKGTHGDTWVVGGAPGMGGAAVLAARAALEAGAGRVHLLKLEQEAGARPSLSGDPAWPELMSATAQDLDDPARWRQATLVAGCGGGTSIAAWLPSLLQHAARLVLDADALNALAADPRLREQLQARRARGLLSILTPHPLEAARLLACTVEAVQSDRLAAAHDLATHLQATVVLKGSGTVTATQGRTPWVNGTGNARLSTAGTGDVLAGWIGGAWKSGDDPHRLAAACVELHGRAADRDESGFVLRAGRLIQQMALQLADAAHSNPG